MLTVYNNRTFIAGLYEYYTNICLIRQNIPMTRTYFYKYFMSLYKRRKVKLTYKLANQYADEISKIDN